jgi:predicted O-methyltransferase YrrM
MRIQRLLLDSTDSATDLCKMCAAFNSDKSPLETPNSTRHRHPYSSVYSMLFSPLRNRPIQFAEIGIAYGASANAWHNWFSSQARLCFFDRDENFVAGVKQSPMSVSALMDVAKDGDVARALAVPGGLYDVILDDSSHEFEHQIRIVKEAIPFVKPGGYIIVEDIYRSRAEKDYEDALADVLDSFSMAYFVVCNHEERWSPGWNNDKMLVLVKS